MSRSKSAFIDAMRITYPIAAGVLLVAVFIAWRYLPARATAERAPEEEASTPVEATVEGLEVLGA